MFGPAFNPVLTLKALCFFADGDLATLPGDVCRRLLDAAAAVDPTKLPSFASLAGVAQGAS